MCAADAAVDASRLWPCKPSRVGLGMQPGASASPRPRRHGGVDARFSFILALSKFGVEVSQVGQPTMKSLSHTQ